MKNVISNTQRYVLFCFVIQLFMVIWAATRDMALSYLPLGITLAGLYILVDQLMIYIKGNRRLLSYLYLLCTLGCIFQTFMSNYLTTSTGNPVISIMDLVANYIVGVLIAIIAVPIGIFIATKISGDKGAIVFTGLAIIGFALLFIIPDEALYKKSGVRIAIFIFGRSIQIMEFIKLGIVLALGFVFASRMPSKKKATWAIVIFGIGALGFMVCSEFGTLLIVLCTCFLFLVMLCDSYKPALSFVSMGAGCVSVFWFLKTMKISFFVKQWSKIEERIVKAWLKSSEYANAAGYQIEEAKKAMSLGGWLGCTKEEMEYYRIAVEDSDMVFPKIISSGGIVLAGMILLLLFLIFRECYYIVFMIQKDTKGILVMGLYMMLLFQVLIILCGSIGILPLTGVPLIFVSHGGMSLISSILSMGCILYCSKKKWRE